MNLPIHPDDVLLFKEVSEAMWRVARRYELPLRNVIGYPMPRHGMADRMGDCAHSGEIRLVLRCTVNGQWEPEPLDPKEVWDTAAHELAHLRHMNHGDKFQDFMEELQVAINNQQQDHKDKILKKLVKLQNQRQGEAVLGNEAAAEAFASMINTLLLRYELEPSDIDYARAQDNDPVIEIKTDLEAYGMDKAKVRSAWQESLAGGIARAHLCTILIQPSTNNIYFVGTKSHATVAEYCYGTMAPFIEKMSKKAEVAYWHATGCGRGIHNKAKGYRAAWIDAFVNRIWERFAEARRAAVAEAAANAGPSSETALLRLDGAMIKVRQYINDKFSHRAAKASQLNFRSRNHAAGRAAGRAAADNITLGQRGLTGSASKQLKD